MRKILIIIFLTLVVGSLSAQERLAVDVPFSSIDVRGKVTVDILPIVEGDSTTKALLTTKGFEVKNIRWSVKKGRLYVDAERGLLEKQGSVHIDIYVSDLRGIYSKGAHINGSTTLASKDLYIETLGSDNEINLNIQVKNLVVKTAGNSDISISGRAEGVTLDSRIASRIDMLHCVVNNAYCKVCESSEIYAFVLELLDAKATTCGTIYYMGDPTLKLRSTLWGAIIPLSEYAGQDLQ